MFGGKCYRDEVHVMLIAVWRTRKRVVWCAEHCKNCWVSSCNGAGGARVSGQHGELCSGIADDNFK